MTTGRMYRNLVPRERTENPGNEVEFCVVRVRKPRRKSRIMTSNIYLVWRSTDEGNVEHIREKKLSL